MKARETGHLSLSLQKWLSRKPICQANKGINHVDLQQIISFFGTLAIGLSLSVLIFIFEHFYYFRQHSKLFEQDKKKRNAHWKQDLFKKSKSNQSWRKYFLNRYGATRRYVLKNSNFYSYILYKK